MKLKPLEIAASAVAAIAAAVVASLFGVKGTVIGAGIGAAVATTVSGLVSQSVARSREAVHRAWVRPPLTTSNAGRTAPATTAPPHAHGAPHVPLPAWRRRRRVDVLVASALAAFVLALLVITGVELAAGKSLSSIVGGPHVGTTVGGIVKGVRSPPRSSTTTTSVTTSTTAPRSTTPTTAPTTSATSTTSTTSTTTTVVSASTTTTPGPHG